jgi:benzoyl-CoA reductase/2-hydroxyglutaryl-CoA dehydratase subunit BcrC/BadD/HgdB
MFNTTLDLFAFNETDDRDNMIDNMADTYFKAMTTCAADNRNFDAIACYEEWVVDGVDPQDGGVEIFFAPDLTLEREEK